MLTEQQATIILVDLSDCRTRCCFFINPDDHLADHRQRAPDCGVNQRRITDFKESHQRVGFYDNDNIAIILIIL